MKCPRCQQENVPDHKFCPECGTPLQGISGSARPSLPYADLQDSLREAQEQQKATSEILRAISHAQASATPVFDAIARSAARLCAAPLVSVVLLDGDMLRL